MTIILSGNVFTSYDVKTKNSSKNENSFEETLQNQKQQYYQTNNQLSQTSSKTSFIDPVNGGKVSVSLENSTLEKLQNRFGVNSVVRNEAGDVELKDKKAFLGFNRHYLDHLWDYSEKVKVAD